MSNKKHHGACVIGAATFWLLAAPAAAQTTGNWELNFELLRMDVKGADAHTGDVVRLTEVQTLSPPQISDRVTHTPIDLDMDAKNTIRAELKHRGRTWGAGVSGWYLRTDDAESGHVSSAQDSMTTSSITSEFNSVLMWNELVSPTRNDLEGSRLSPLDFQVSGRLRTFALDGFALASLVSNDTIRLELILGGKLARVRSGQDQDLKLRAFILNAFRPQHLNNNIELSSTADANFTGVGPMVGWAGRATWRRLRFDASVTESAIYASSKQTGVFSDVDDITVAQSPTGPFATCPPALVALGCFSVRSDWNFEKSSKVVIPVTELQLKVLVDVARNIAVGASSFTSIWNNVPAPPAFTMTHADAGPGLDWDFGQRSLRFGSAGVVVNFRF
jgi:hypothetical protein